MKGVQAVLLCGILLSGCLAGCKPAVSRPAAPVIVRYFAAIPFHPEQWSPQSGYIGQVRGDSETDLSFKLGGILDLIGPDKTQDWREGATVTNGQLLVQLAQSDFTNNLLAIRAKVELERKLHERSVKLLETKVISPQEYDIIEANWKASEADLAKAEQALRDSQLRAPYTGTLLARLVNVGETIAAGQVVLRVADLRQMSVELGVPDRLVEVVSQLREQEQVIPVRISALGERTFEGRITEVGVAARDGARLFRVTIKIPNPEGRIKSGMTASVSFTPQADTTASTVLVPLSALVASNRPGSTNLAVFVLESGDSVREQEVLTDDIVRNSVVITQGLKAGEKVVCVGASSLYDGARVDARLMDD
ncbi:MAG TPA: efflux RND transporter periplasmic adaptor subunit [Candidatus Paceibacterota bacterium]|nr:efflux RND transporter periplasmic adaptor subunit [Verrucomicrobiota bacterium]HRY49265.1 efflux RND transporter periplasmic adaptor subunit [Candidatus Paceibacterota bacterium]HSA00479.1 efflux RND transporter periplasmic adaptor subunit [Candidatus Paceibacterota bacterium]